jgi:iron complex outermembrane receptor protein
MGTADDPGIPNSTHFYAGGLRAGELGFSASMARPVQIGLPSALNVAVGATYRQETWELVPGEKGSWIQGGHMDQYGDPAPPGSQVFSGFLPTTAADESRGNTGAYVDLETDLTKKLLVNAAARFEDYTDFGSNLSWKLAARFQPAKQFVLRGAFSTGFRAPSLAQSFYGSRITNFRLDPETGKQAPFEVGIFPVQSDVAQALGAKPLKPETSLNYSAGFAWSPTDQFNVTVDGYLIDLHDRILLTGNIGGDSVEKILEAKGLPITSAQYFTNIIDTRTTGIDLTGNYRTTLGSFSSLLLTAGANFTKNEISDQRPLPPQLEGTGAELVDKFTTLVIEKERPDWRGTLTANLSRGKADLLARGSYYGKFYSAPGLCDNCEQLFGAKTLFDLETGYRLGAMRWALGARNLFNVFPDKQSLDNGYGIFPWAGASPFGYNGRFVYVRTEMTFGR